MPVYEFRCDSCGHKFDVVLKLVDNKSQQFCVRCGGKTQKIVSRVNFNLSGDNWPSKALRIKEQGLKRREAVSKKMEEKVRYEPMPSLVPNVDGQIAGSWEDASKLAKSRGKDHSTYQGLIESEKTK